MKYSIVIQKKAQKFIRKQSKPEQERLLKAIYKLPYEGDIKALKNYPELMRLRVGSYRIIFSVNNDILTVFIIDAGNRRQIYKNI